MAHPPGQPGSAIPVDMRTYQKILADPELSMTVLVAIIVGPLDTIYPDRPAASAQAPAWVIDAAEAVRTPLHLLPAR